MSFTGLAARREIVAADSTTRTAEGPSLARNRSVPATGRSGDACRTVASPQQCLQTLQPLSSSQVLVSIELTERRLQGAQVAPYASAESSDEGR